MKRGAKPAVTISIPRTTSPAPECGYRGRHLEARSKSSGIALRLILGFIGVLTLGVGGVGVMNIAMLVSVTERYEGSRSAQGAGQRAIANIALHISGGGAGPDPLPPAWWVCWSQFCWYAHRNPAHAASTSGSIRRPITRGISSSSTSSSVMLTAFVILPRWSGLRRPACNRR